MRCTELRCAKYAMCSIELKKRIPVFLSIKYLIKVKINVFPHTIVFTIEMFCSNMKF